MSLDAEREACRLLFQDGLTETDTAWLRNQFHLAGLPTPDHDVSWITTEEVSSGGLAWPVWLAGVPMLVLGVLHFVFGVV